jgi:hypothetical protein
MIAKLICDRGTKKDLCEKKLLGGNIATAQGKWRKK